jgi:hypothetical protein
VARSTPPSLISYTEVSYATTGNLVSASVSWQTGDVVIVIALTEGTNTVAVPTATGLTFASQQSNVTGSTCNGRISAVVAGATSSGAVTTAITGAGESGMGVWVWRGSDGIGVSVEQHTATRTKALVPTDTHSAYCWTVGDFNAGVTTSVVLTPTPTTTQESAQQATHYTVYSGNLNDQASSASTNFGTSGGTVTGPSTILAIEILGTGTAVTLPPLVMAPQRR